MSVKGSHPAAPVVLALLLLEGSLVGREKLFLLLLGVDPVLGRADVVGGLATFRASSGKHTIHCVIGLHQHFV